MPSAVYILFVLVSRCGSEQIARAPFRCTVNEHIFFVVWSGWSWENYLKTALDLIFSSHILISLPNKFCLALRSLRGKCAWSVRGASLSYVYDICRVNLHAHILPRSFWSSFNQLRHNYIERALLLLSICGIFLAFWNQILRNISL